MKTIFVCIFFLNKALKIGTWEGRLVPRHQSKHRLHSSPFTMGTASTSTRGGGEASRQHHDPGPGRLVDPRDKPNNNADVKEGGGGQVKKRKAIFTSLPEGGGSVSKFGRQIPGSRKSPS